MERTDKINISFIIPVYNTQEYIEECVKSILRNFKSSDLSYEILLANDGSTDQSGEILSRLAESNDSIKVFHLPHTGPGYARNYAFQQAKGEYVWFVDSDDYLLDHVVDPMFQLAKRNDADVACCDVCHIVNGKVKASKMHLWAFGKMNPGQEVTNLQEHPELVFDAIVCNKLIRRQFLIDQHIRYVDEGMYEDMLMALQIYHKANKVAYLRTRGYCWRKRSDSTTQDVTNIQFLKDKKATIQSIFSYAKEKIQSLSVLDCLEEKLLDQYISTFLNGLPTMEDKEQINQILDFLAELLKRYIHEERSLSKVSLCDQQIYWDIIHENYDNVVKLINYRKTNYPYVRIKDDYTMVLPDTLFEIKTREAKGDFYRSIPPTSIYDMNVEDNKISFFVSLFINRISVPEKDTQKIQAYLVNDISKKCIPLEAETVNTHFLTETKGTAISRDDYFTYKYNYDWAGVKIVLDQFDALYTDDFNGYNHIVLQYHHPLYEGVRVLRVASGEIKQQLTQIVSKKGNKKITFQFDKGDTLEILSSLPEEKGKEDVIPIDTYVKYYEDMRTNARNLANSNKEAVRIINQLKLENNELKEANEAAILIHEKEEYELRTKTNEYNQIKTELEDKLRLKETELRKVKNSWNYKLSSILLWLPKKIYYFFKRLFK